MQMQAYAIKDLKGDCFFMPFYMETEAQAKRVVINTAMDSKTSLNMFASDFALYELGIQDFVTGKFVETIRMVDTVNNLVNQYLKQHPEDEENEEDF